ncbi:lytic transglycosylase domain-containing protein [Methylocystis sp. MJC1]|jgi:hypothetical protein|uniref:lytic transglycosylase domain-containing protein n=3 Tax=Methylocystis sp. MJC1 TaxID=2654282 RepID=UPI001FEF32CB|nr:transglycosylase SLT domain-containing protein [Methylocystis sp. MJC1]
MQRDESQRLSALFRPARTSFGICLLSGALASDICHQPQMPAVTEAAMSAHEAVPEIDAATTVGQQLPVQAARVAYGPLPSVTPDATSRVLLIDMVRAEAKIRSVPEDLAQAVAYIESAYDPEARGAVGEIGLMQVLPSTAAMMGFKGVLSDLSIPRTNIYYGVSYLAKAWRLSNGDVCRALMKYRAGLGEERMTARSIDYCRRAKLYLAQINSPFKLEDAAASRVASNANSGSSAIAPTLNVSVGALLSGKPLIRTQSPKRVRSSESFWAWHEARIRALKQKVHAKWSHSRYAQNRS